jgi:hypothetical protein
LKHKLTPYHIKSCISMDFLKYTKQMSPSDWQQVSLVPSVLLSQDPSMRFWPL